jgi:hypothetical protein
MTTNTKLFILGLPAFLIAIAEGVWWCGGPAILHEIDKIAALVILLRHDKSP